MQVVVCNWVGDPFNAWVRWFELTRSPKSQSTYLEDFDRVNFEFLTLTISGMAAASSMRAYWKAAVPAQDPSPAHVRPPRLLEHLRSHLRPVKLL